MFKQRARFIIAAYEDTTFDWDYLTTIVLREQLHNVQKGKPTKPIIAPWVAVLCPIPLTDTRCKAQRVLIPNTGTRIGTRRQLQQTPTGRRLTQTSTVNQNTTTTKTKKCRFKPQTSFATPDNNQQQETATTTNANDEGWSSPQQEPTKKRKAEEERQLK